MESVKVANFWAKLSCPKWDKFRPLRHFARNRYRKLAQKCWESEVWQRKIKQYKSGNWNIDTYPGPYYHQYFADWEENDSPEGYNLISDQSNCVIKYSTSYCAWKIFEATGVWPQKISKERLDAKRWVQFLAEAGYTEVVKDLDPRYYYVGINPDIGEWGLVVWLESIEDKDEVIVSSYPDKRHQWWATEKDAYTWVKICPRPSKQSDA
ncbi:MAG: hypothetical protein Q4A25_02635 [Candidatus Saccharibacteria bacterium]|nr:hypothetical protein [Candidatus Saccharibacteria bacterium]